MQKEGSGMKAGAHWTATAVLYRNVSVSIVFSNKILSHTTTVTTIVPLLQDPGPILELLRNPSNRPTRRAYYGRDRISQFVSTALNAQKT